MKVRKSFPPAHPNPWNPERGETRKYCSLEPAAVQFFFSGRITGHRQKKKKRSNGAASDSGSLLGWSSLGFGLAVRVRQPRGVAESYGLLRNREREILQLLTKGKTNKAVATMLTISLYTVEAHRSHILQKPNLHNSAELVLFAVGKGVIS